MIFKRYAIFPLVLLVVAAGAQQTGTAPSSGPLTLDVVVTPNNGKPVSGLQQQDFKVLDNKAAQAISSFTPSDAKTPVEIVLLIDAVNATYSTVASERGQIEKYLRANGGRLAHPTTLALFTESGTEIQPSSSTDGNALCASLDSLSIGLRNLRRSTGIYGAQERLDLSLKALELIATHESTRPGRKLVLWISPGWPLLSGPGVQLSRKAQDSIFLSAVRISTMLQQGKTMLYALDALGATEPLERQSYYRSFVKGLGRPQDALLGNLALQVFAAHSGGQVLNSNDLTDLLHRAADDADSWYEITYQPSPPERPNEYHSIEVQVAKPGLTARTITGYYANPSGGGQEK